ncbi:MAG: HD domain-containing protein, partial [Elusimicrobiales bacterium]|nr:HD domain-containing protein [Elusimicrobiales bacterium]
MNETIKIAAAAFLHDIGKLLQRIAADSGEKLPDCFPAVNYQGNKDWLRHAAWTAFFIKNGLGPLPGIDNADSFADLAAKHHLDSSSISVCELIIKTADSIASGMEKQENDRHISAACG